MQSPHRPSSADLSGGLGTLSPSKGPFCARSSLHSQIPLSSASPRPRPSGSTPIMATAFSESASSLDQKPPHSQSFMNIDDASSTQWTPQYHTPTSGLPRGAACFPVSAPYTPEPAASFFDCSTNGLPYTSNYNLTYPTLNMDPTCPRSSFLNGLGLTGPMGNMNISESYPPSAYMIEPSRSHEGVELADQSTSQLMQLNNDYDSHCTSNIKVEESPYGSPYGSAASTRCSTPHQDFPGMPPRDLKHDGVDDSAIDKEQPYAQLIYRALMEAPNHTMILRDIYNWFKENTDKAADKETKGWQNSIRHNLSMNGAFEKVDQPCEDSRKGFMWRLTEEAIREGVKSTTRYRSKQPNKRGHRSHHPLPQRQASGAKGGQAAKRSAKLRRSQREYYAHRSDPYAHRSVPNPYLYDPASFNPTADTRMTYSLSPYQHSEVDFGHPSSYDDFGAPLIAHGADSSPYAGSPLSTESFGGDTAYVQMPHDPAEALFYSTEDSPSPTASEPHTPPGSEMDCYVQVGPSEDTFNWADTSSTYRE